MLFQRGFTAIYTIYTIKNDIKPYRFCTFDIIFICIEP